MKSLTKIDSILLILYFIIPQGIIFNQNQTPGESPVTDLSFPAFLINVHISTDIGLRFTMIEQATMIYSIIFFGPGFLFVTQVIRFLRGKTSRKATITLGLLSICPTMILVTLPMIINRSSILMIPIPTILAIGVIVMNNIGPQNPDI